MAKPAWRPGEQYPEGDPKMTDTPETQPNPMGIKLPELPPVEKEVDGTD